MEDSNSGCIMEQPPLFSTVRINLHKVSIDSAKELVEAMVKAEYEDKPSTCIPVVSVHPVLKDLLVIRGSGPHEVKPASLEIYVDKCCGSAVMRGSVIYAVGILGSSRGFGANELCAVYMDTEGACLRGRVVPYRGKRVLLGNGRLLQARKDIFQANEPNGIGCVMVEPVWNQPSLGKVIGDWGYPQNLPSVLCAHLLNCEPGAAVLDMCAAPGGKALHIASIMQNRGTVIALDSSARRLEVLKSHTQQMGLSCIRAFHWNATKCLSNAKYPPGASDSEPPFRPESFGRILLDAPCSASGQRPRFIKLPEAQLKSYPPLQKRLLDKAVQLLKDGGILLYSTCSVQEDENEAQVRYVLDKWPNMKLIQQEPRLVRGSKDSKHLKTSERRLVQKFDPRKFCSIHENRKFSDIPVDYDTIGFFIAVFVKSK